MVKSNYVSIYFNSVEDKISFDSWFETIEAESVEDMAEQIDNFLMYSQYEELYEPIEDFVFGIDGNEEEYLSSLEEVL